MDRDSLALGRIKEIHKYKLIISLPHNKTGVCQISSISDSYNSLLKKFVDEDSDQSEVQELNQLFTKGQLVQLKLIKNINSNKFDLSMIPSAINGSINLNLLKPGMKLQVAISSREDKGYILETGICGLNGFLSFEDCSNENYGIGKVIEVYPIITNKEKSKGQKSRVLNFTTNAALKTEIFTFGTNIDFNSILPGTLIKAELKRCEDDSLEGKYFGFPVSVKSDHHKLQDSPSGELLLCVIGLETGTKQLDCSMLQHLRSPFKGLNELVSLPIGYSRNDAIVSKMEKNQMFLTIPDVNFATCLVTKAHMESNLQKLDEGSVVVARYLDYNLMDNRILATTLTSLISLSYFSVHQAKLGEIIKGTIKKFSKSGFSVQISSQLTGLIPICHLSDKTINAPHTVYKTGDLVKCRVFHVDREENKLLLTVRKSLMNSSLPVVSDFGDFETNMVLDGTVVKIMEFGLIVVLFSNIRGWVPISRVPQLKQKSLSMSYVVGEHVQVKVIRWDEKTNKVELSLKLEQNTISETQEMDDENQSNFVEVGKVFDAVVKANRIDGFNVLLLPINKVAFLPLIQLSDSREHRALFQAHYTSAANKEECKMTVTVISNHKGIIVSKKNSLISAAVSGTLLVDPASVTLESQWTGWISKKESYGLFVQLPCGASGLVPNKHISDIKRMNGVQSSDLFQVGDTVEVKVLEKNPAKPNCYLFTMKMSDTYRAADHMSVGCIDFLKSHLKERKYLKLLPSCQKVQDVEIGNLVNVTITKQCEWGFTLQIDNTNEAEPVTGFVRNQFLPETVLNEGGSYRAIVIDVDLSELTVEVCMIGSYVNAVANKNSNSTKINIDQTISSDVLFFNNDFVVAMLKGHANGIVVYIPTKRFWNDMVKSMVWVSKQRNPTIIKSILADKTYVGTLVINEAIVAADVNPDPVSSPVLFRNLANKIKIQKGAKYPAFFHSITKNKLFFYISKRQKGFCNFIDYCDSVDDLQNLIVNPPQPRTLLEKEVTILSSKTKTNPSYGHFLKKSTIEVGDVICGKVISNFKTNKYRLKLPFNSFGFIDPSRENSTKISNDLRINSVIQCRVNKISQRGTEKSYFVSVASLDVLENGDNGGDDEVEEDKEEEDNEQIIEDEKMEVDLDEEEPENSESEDETSQTEENPNEDDEMPIIITRTTKSDEQDNLTSLYKRIHKSDDEEDSGENKEDCKPTPAKQRKLKKMSNVERELMIRNAEKRRETGENLKDPKNEAEFELLIFNCPNESSSWLKYMRFVLETEQNVDKARGIAERAMKTLQVRDTESRFRMMKEYIDLEIAQLVSYDRSDDVLNYDNQLQRFRRVLDRGLAQKAKLIYIHVCEKLIENQLLDLAEEIAKIFIREFHCDSLSWFQLFYIRFIQKKYAVVKETITNSERSLKAADFRDLNIRVAQTEIEKGDSSRGVEILVSMFEKRPKDNSLKNRIIAIFDKNGLSQHISRLEARAKN